MTLKNGEESKVKKMQTQKQFTIRKKIAKHGCNSIIVIPKLLQDDLKPKTIVELNIKVLEEPKTNESKDSGDNENEL